MHALRLFTRLITHNRYFPAIFLFWLIILDCFCLRNFAEFFSRFFLCFCYSFSHSFVVVFVVGVMPQTYYAGRCYYFSNLLSWYFFCCCCLRFCIQFDVLWLVVVVILVVTILLHVAGYFSYFIYFYGCFYATACCCYCLWYAAFGCVISGCFSWFFVPPQRIVSTPAVATVFTVIAFIVHSSCHIHLLLLFLFSYCTFFAVVNIITLYSLSLHFVYTTSCAPPLVHRIRPLRSKIWQDARVISRKRFWRI